MDLGTLLTRALHGYYRSPAAARADVELLLANCAVFNPEGHPVLAAARDVARVLGEALRQDDDGSGGGDGGGGGEGTPPLPLTAAAAEEATAAAASDQLATAAPESAAAETLSVPELPNFVADGTDLPAESQAVAPLTEVPLPQPSSA